MDETRAESWTHLHELLFADSRHEALQRHRSDFVFRGEGARAANLETSLQRLGGDFGEVETHLLRNFRKYAQRSDVPADTLWHWVALAKHHGLPTRLLDWTYSPYVALHFATTTLQSYDVDGVVWAVDYVRAHELLPSALRALLDDDGANVFTAELLDRVAQTRSELDVLAEDEDFVLFLEPPSLDQRIVAQYALFSLMSSADASLDAWIDEHEQLVRKIVIPAELKWEIRDKLDQANITERVLFPGLDGLSAWLRRYYLPRSD